MVVEAIIVGVGELAPRPRRQGEARVFEEVVAGDAVECGLGVEREQEILQVVEVHCEIPLAQRQQRHGAWCQ
jgi:hypothetical protein